MHPSAILHVLPPGQAWEGAGTQSKAVAPNHVRGSKVIWSFLWAPARGFIWMGLKSGQLKIHPKQSPRADGKVTAQVFVFPSVFMCSVVWPHLSVFALSPVPLTMAPWLAPCFSPHRREGCGGRAVPLPLVLPLLSTCLQVLRRRLEALGGEALLWGRE